MHKATVSLPPDVYKALQFYAVETDHTMSEVIVDALRRIAGIRKWMERGKEDKEA